MAKRILEARVKQKKDTLANWMANDLILLDGEQAFVTNANGREVNYKIGDGTKKFSELEFMIQYDQAAFVAVTSNALPEPTGQVRYSLVTSGTYTQSGGGNITVPVDTIAVLADNGTTWYIESITNSLKGVKGDKGDGLQVSGSVQSYSDLALISPVPNIGDSYVVNDDGLLYVYGENGFPPDGQGIEFITKKFTLQQIGKMAINQEYNEYRVNDLPTSGNPGDRYYLNVGGGKYMTYIMSDAGLPTRESGAEFIEKDTVAYLRAMSAREIWAIQNGYYKGVRLNGYYTKGDTPAPIEYYLSDTTEEDNGGSVFEVGGIKLEHEFVGEVDVRYFGVFPQNADNTPMFDNIAGYVNDGHKIIFAPNVQYKGNFKSVGKSISVDFNNSTIIPITPNVGAFCIWGSRGDYIDVDLTNGYPKYNDVSVATISEHGLVEGDLFVLRDEALRPSDNKADENQEILKVKSVDGNTIYVEDVIRGTFNTGTPRIQKVNKISNVEVQRGNFYDIDSVFPMLWITCCENVTVNNNRVDNFFGNAVRLDYCYSGETNSNTFYKPRATESGEGYGFAINFCRGINGEKAYGTGTRHILDYKGSYNCTFKKIFEPDAKSSPVVLAHNGFGGNITVEDIYTVGDTYSVSISAQGFSPDNLNTQVWRGFKVRDVNHIWKNKNPNEFLSAVRFNGGDYADVTIENIRADFDSEANLTDVSTLSNVVQLTGNKKGTLIIRNISSECVGTPVRLDIRVASTQIFRHATVLENLSAYKCATLSLINGDLNVNINGLDSYEVLQGVITLNRYLGQNPNYIQIGDKGLSMTMRQSTSKLIFSTSAPTEIINGSIPRLFSGTGSSFSVSTEEAIIPLDRLYNSSGHLRVLPSSNLTLNSTTPLELSQINGHEVTLVIGVLGDFSVNRTLTIPSGNSTVQNSTPIVMQYGKAYNFVFFSGRWRFQGESSLDATTTVKGLVNQATAVPDGSSIDTLLASLRAAGILAT